jgi:hypothetical protein
VPAPYNIEIGVDDRRFEFQIHHRELDLWGRRGANEKLCRYYWMDSRQWRQGRRGPNFRACVDFWWMLAEKYGDGSDALETLALAECYPLVNTARSMQEVYRDAHLRPESRSPAGAVGGQNEGDQFESNVALTPDDDEYLRLRSVARRRDTALLQQELERLFLGTNLNCRDQRQADEQASQLVNGLVDAFKSGGRDELIKYTATIDQLIHKIRRRGGVGNLRTFLNVFSYECKLAFYTCYATSWSAIVHRLEQTEPNNKLGHRLMRLWHHQNRPEYGHGRDAFCGQVLALHPLSKFMLTSSEHLEALRQWVDHPSYDAIAASGQAGQQEEYWELCGSILVAATEYIRSRDRAESRRSTRSDVPPDIERGMGGDEEPSISQTLEDYFAARSVRCDCAGELKHLSHAFSDDGAQSEVTMTCAECGINSTHVLDRRGFIQSRR